MTPADLQSAGWTTREFEGFTGQLGTLWMRSTGPERVVGFFVDARHTNNHLGTCHGGAIMTFADVALGFGVAGALGHVNCATAQLQNLLRVRGASRGVRYVLAGSGTTYRADGVHSWPCLRRR